MKLVLGALELVLGALELVLGPLELVLGTLVLAACKIAAFCLHLNLAIPEICSCLPLNMNLNIYH